MHGCRSARYKARSRRRDKDDDRAAIAPHRDASGSDMSWRAYKRAARAQRRAARGCATGGGQWAYWWLIFPLFFGGPAVLDAVDGLDGALAGIAQATDAALHATLAAPMAELIARATNLSFGAAFLMIASSALVTVTVALLALRTPGEGPDFLEREAAEPRR